MTEADQFVAMLSPKAQTEFKQIVLDRMMKHFETKEQAERIVIQFIRAIRRLSMSDRLDRICVVLAPLSAVMLCVLTYSLADKLSNGLLALGTITMFFLGLCMKTAGERLILANLAELKQELENDRYENGRRS